MWWVISEHYAKETTLGTDCLYGKSEIRLWFQTLKFSCDRCCHGRQVSEPPITASRALINTVRGGKDLPRQNLFTFWWAKSLPWVSGNSKSGSALEEELGSKGSSRIGRVEALLTLGTFLEHPGKRSWADMVMETSISQEPCDPTRLTTSKLVVSPGWQTPRIQKDLHRCLMVSHTARSE